MLKSDATASQHYWNGRAESFDSQYEDLEIRKRVARRVVELARPGAGETIVDLGVGTARIFREGATQFAKAAKLIGIDFAENMLAQAKALTEAEGLTQFVGHLGHYTEIPLDSGSVDCVISSLALHHVTDDEKASVLGEIARVLKAQGRVIIADQMNCTGRSLSDGELRQLMVATFFPQIPMAAALEKTSSHKEYTCSIEHMLAMLVGYGFVIEEERLTDVVGIVYSTSRTKS